METGALFVACTTQCEWCKEQWPVILHNGHIAHVAPYTRDPLLFQTACAAESIRKAFDYMNYAGGARRIWRVPSPDALGDQLGKYYGGCQKKLGKNISSPNNRSFWRCGLTATIEVESWPDWKRGICRNSEPDKVPASERLRRVRAELLFYDAMDYWTRQTCTDNLQYRPTFDEKGCMVRPSCNHSIGCSTCWERYQAKSDEIDAHSCV